MNYKILVIDDNQMIRAFLSHLFEKKNEVSVKTSAEEALLWLNNKNYPDAIITDYELEGMSGLELLTRLKNADAFKNIPVIILSGKGKSDHRIKCLEAGAADFIIKPFNPGELEIKIYQIIQSGSSGIDIAPN